MSGTEWLVMIGGLTVIGWVNWYFFVAQGATGSSAAAPARRETPAEEQEE
jgi:hypothetical protein